MKNKKLYEELLKIVEPRLLSDMCGINNNGQFDIVLAINEIFEHMDNVQKEVDEINEEYIKLFNNGRPQQNNLKDNLSEQSKVLKLVIKERNCLLRQLGEKMIQIGDLHDKIESLKDDIAASPLCVECGKVDCEVKKLREENVLLKKAYKEKCDTLKSQLDFAVQQKECLEQQCKELKQTIRAYEEDRFCQGGCAIYQYDKIHELTHALSEICLIVNKFKEQFDFMGSDLEELNEILDIINKTKRS